MEKDQKDLGGNTVKRYYGVIKGSFDVMAEDEEDLYSFLSKAEIDGVNIDTIDITDVEEISADEYFADQIVDERKMERIGVGA